MHPYVVKTVLAPKPMTQFWHPNLWHSFGTHIYDTILATTPLKHILQVGHSFGTRTLDTVLAPAPLTHILQVGFHI